jgi:ectoine hydroxylase-related dioxygenase (phytanoyl-CoA dioxygenase family)
MQGDSQVREHLRVLSEAKIAEYQDKGYATIPGALDPDLVARIIAATDRLRAAGRHVSAGTRHYDIEPGHRPERPRIRRVSSPTELDDVFVETTFDSVLGDIAADLIGGPVKFYHSKINFKLPGGGAEIGWPRDWAVFPHTNTNLVALSVPLNPSRASNGCLRSIPRTHEDLATAEESEVDPSDVVAHHGLAVHGSPPNHFDAMRTTYIIQHAAADAFARRR